MSTNLLKVIGFDPSMSNWGIAEAFYNTSTGVITVEKLSTISPVVDTYKTVRKNNQDIDRARQLSDAAIAACKGAVAVFVEVPVGSQTARAAVSYGLCIGILGALQQQGISFFELTAKEVKLAGAGSVTATKKEMIQWAVAAHPEAPWPYHTRAGKQLVTESMAEHQADAVAAIHAGIASQPFKQLLQFINK